MERLKRYLPRVLVAALALLLVGALCEGLVRFFNLEEPRFIEHDPVYGTFHIPDQRGWWTKPVKPAYIEINSRGFRGPVRPYEKPPGLERIVIIGDSYIEAFAASYEETLGHQLEESLRAKGRNVEVIALGVSNFGTAQEILLLEREGLRYQPDLVVLAFAHNDPTDNYRKLSRDTDRPYFRLKADGSLERLPYHMRSKTRGPVRDWMRRNLRIFTFFPRHVRDSLRVIRGKVGKASPWGTHGPLESYQFYASTATPEGKEAWAVTLELIKEFRRLTEAAGARFVLMDIPFRYQVTEAEWEILLERYPERRRERDDFANPEPQEILGELCRKESMRCLFLLPIFRGEGARSVRLFAEKDMHWNGEGNRLVARALEAFLEPSLPALKSPKDNLSSR